MLLWISRIPQFSSLPVAILLTQVTGVRGSAAPEEVVGALARPLTIISRESWFCSWQGSAFTSQIFFRLLRHGQIAPLRRAWLGYAYFLKTTQALHFNYLVAAFYVCVYSMPFLLRSKNISTRQYTFPVTAGWVKRMRFGFRFFSEHLRTALGMGVRSRFGDLWSTVLFHYTDSALAEQLEKLIETGVDNRAYMHYRWSGDL